MKYLVIALFAGHGILVKEAMQHVVLYEFDHKKGYYKLFHVERIIRAWAENNNNAYVIAINACCRSVYNENEMNGSGCDL